MTSSFEIVEHTADVALLLRGESRDGLLGAAVGGFASLLLETPPPGPGTRTETFLLPEDDLGEMLVRLLNQLIYLFDVRKVVPVAMESVTESQHGVVVRVGVVVFDPDVHFIQTLMKAATYHQLEVLDAGGWKEVRVVLDT